MPSACANSAEDDYYLEDNPVPLTGRIVLHPFIHLIEQIVLHPFDCLSYLYPAFRVSRSSNLSNSRRRVYRGSRMRAPRTHLRPFLVLNIINYPKKRRKPCLIFPDSGVDYCSETDAASGGFRFRALFIGYFSKRNRKPAKFQTCSFAPEFEIYQQGSLCLHVLLGVFLFISGAGSWLDLHRRA